MNSFKDGKFEACPATNGESNCKNYCPFYRFCPAFRKNKDEDGEDE